MDGSTTRTETAATADPSSVSDVLYLIAARQDDTICPELVQTLNDAYICYLRGDLQDGLDSISAVENELDPTLPAYDDVRALRLFLLGMADQRPGRWTTEKVERAQEESGSYRVVALCVASNDYWYSGRLFKGLRSNHSAVQHALTGAATWRLYSGMLLAKKLSDIHISDQAARIIANLQGLVDSSGLHAFESIPEALRSLLLLQSGQYDRAIESAAAAIRVAELRATIVGMKLARSVSATARLALGDLDGAAADLASFHAIPDCYALPDSLARAAFVEIALIASRDGPRAAAQRIHAQWHLLGTDSATFVEDPTRPAWLVSVAQRACDSALAEQALAAIERLVTNNEGVSPLETAAGHARTVYKGEEMEVPSILDAAAGPRTGLPRRQSPSPSGQPRLRSLSRREDEVARLVGSGLTNIQVANQLGLSPHTVNFHLRNIFRKLSISTRVKLGHIVAQSDRS